MAFARAVRIGAVAAVAAAVVVAQPAAAAKGQVIVFEHEFTPALVYAGPSGCTRLPAGAHVMVNQTDAVITIYGDPFCAAPIEPFARIEPGYASHVSAVGSFSA